MTQGLEANISEVLVDKTETDIYADIIGKYCIVRCYGAGVFFGIVDSVDNNYTALLKKSRRIHYWDDHTACSISDLAKYGIAQNDNSGRDSRIAVEIESQLVFQIIELIPCTPKSIESLQNYKVWSENEK